MAKPNRSASSEHRYDPLVPVAVAVFSGSWLDRRFSLPVGSWLSAALFIGAVWLCLRWFRKDRRAAWCLLLAVACLAGAWHHRSWHWFARRDVGLGVIDRTAVSLRAAIRTAPLWTPAPPASPLTPMARRDATQTTIQVRQVRRGRRWTPAVGRLTMLVQGDVSYLDVGDEVEIYGYLVGPPARSNPGQFDTAQYWRSLRQLSQLRVVHAACVRRLARGNRWNPRHWLGRIRQRCFASLERHLDPPTAALATALLLGNRAQLDDATRDGFLVTGTMHLLAISGMHVGLLVSGCWLLARGGLLGRRKTLVFVVSVTVAYVLLAEMRPPVTRAAALIVLICAARWRGQRVLSMNVLAACGLVVWTLGPSQIFQTGTQLSFLAVATLAKTAELWPEAPPPGALSRLLDATRAAPLRWARYGLGALTQVWLICLVVWLVSAPLVAAQFHIVAPVGILLGPCLGVPVALALFSGAAVLLVDPIWPLAARLPAVICQTCLQLTQALIEACQQLPIGHRWVAGPSAWWLFGFYLLVVLWLIGPGRNTSARRGLALLCCWVAIGLAWERNPETWSGRQAKLSCTFLSVGHGTCVVLQTPSNRCLVYDAGHLGDPEVSARRIAAGLWSLGVERIDVLFVSHADLDHFNAVPGLAHRVEIGCLVTPPRTLDDRSPSIVALLKALQQHNIPLFAMSTGNQLRWDGCSITALHPPVEGVEGSDNANSLVLALRYGGYQVLLPGDVEDAGLDRLLALPGHQYQVVMAPHHGSRHSRQAEVRAWSGARVWIVSGGESTDTAHPAWHTADGAVRVLVGPEGCQVQRWIEGRFETQATLRTPSDEPE